MHVHEVEYQASCPQSHPELSLSQENSVIREAVCFLQCFLMVVLMLILLDTCYPISGRLQIISTLWGQILKEETSPGW